MSRYSSLKRMFCAVVCAALCAPFLAGCSTSNEPTRYRVQGEVKFNGQPVQFGEVLFTPDGTQGNSGAQGVATITNGRYDTQGSRAPGIAGGPMVITVTALQDERGTLLVEHEFRLNLPKEDTTHNIDIPAKAPAASQKTSPEI